MPSELLDRVLDALTEEQATAVMNGAANWYPGGWGNVITGIKSIVVHGTEGWPTRAKARSTFVTRYTTARYGVHGDAAVVPCPNCPPNPHPVAAAGCECKWGIGPMYYVSNDGTIARLISNVRDEARLTWHAGYLNGASIGVETGNLFNDIPPGPGTRWQRVEQHPAHDDIPGANLHLARLRENPEEVIACWFTTAAYAGPAREHVGAGWMLYSEAQYRAWTNLGRFLAEQFDVPRNLPLLPWEDRPANVNSAANYRRIVLADPAFDAIVAGLPAAWNMTAATFADAAQLQTAYHARIAGLQNQAWNRLFTAYRGFLGHFLSGDDGAADHECPGPVFDWHRFARELWDWWWYPFDVAGAPPMALPTTAVARRGYRQPNRGTPLLEHYFDDDNQDPLAGPDATHAARARAGVQGHGSSPATWRLDPGSPVYALANGELVAARFAQPAGVASLSFVLVRHLVFHRTVGGADPIRSLRLDYDLPASTVYSLYMHIGHPAGLDLTAVNAANPDWLNRVLIRRKECDLGMTFFGDPTHHGIPDAAWNQPLPGGAVRPTLVDGWRNDQTALTTFMTALSAGQVAIAPFADQTTPIRVILGDYLGDDGVIANENGVPAHGTRVEVFSPQVLPGFTPLAVVPAVGWADPPAGFAGVPVQQYQSEWARTLSAQDTAALTALGVDAALVTWWPEVARAMATDPGVVAADRLPPDGNVFHYQPFDFLRWINGITWKSEWPKYQVHDAGGNPVAAPVAPRSRRI